MECFHFQVIDSGHISPQEELVLIDGNIENAGRNLCVLLRLEAVDMGRIGEREANAHRGMVSPIARELRRPDIGETLMDSGSLKGEFPLEGVIVKRNSHDATRPSQGRDFRTPGFLFISVLTVLMSRYLRICGNWRGAN